MPEYHYIAYSVCSPEGNRLRMESRLINKAPLTWLLETQAAYSDLFALVHTFPITEAQYLAHKDAFQ